MTVNRTGLAEHSRNLAVEGWEEESNWQPLKSSIMRQDASSATVGPGNPYALISCSSRSL